MPTDTVRRDSVLIGVLAAVIIVNAFLFLLSRDQTFIHIDAIAHVNKARALLDNLAPGLSQLGSIWLPLPHLLMVPLAWFDVLWLSGTAGSLVSLACFVGTCLFLFSISYTWTGSRLAAWMAFLCFALNPRLLYLFTTPMTEPLMIFCSAGLLYYLLRWTEDETWRSFAMAGLMAFAGTLTRYEGWAFAAAAVFAVPILARSQRIASTILFAGAAALGPMLWMLYNMFYFEDPLFFIWGRGSAQDYAREHLLRTGQTFPTAGSLWESVATYFIDVAYCLNPAVLWLGLAGIVISLAILRLQHWRPVLILLMGTAAPFTFYVYNLYSNSVPILMPGLFQSQPESIFNVRYGSAMAATIPIFASMFLFFIIRGADRNRAFSLLLLAPMIMPNPIPSESHETGGRQFTQNLFYTEAIRNQSFWMPAFVEVGRRLKMEIEETQDQESLILADSRIIHVVVWKTGIPMHRFVNETHKGYWEPNLRIIGPEIRWVITEEGDLMWHAQGEFLQANFIEVAHAKSPSSGVVHLYRRPD